MYYDIHLLTVGIRINRLKGVFIQSVGRVRRTYKAELIMFLIEPNNFGSLDLSFKCLLVV